MGFFFKQKRAYEIEYGPVGWEMCIRDSFQANGSRGFVVLGAVVVCIPGGGALYADMGHFGRKPIQVAWDGLLPPALGLNYFGPGALTRAARRVSGPTLLSLYPPHPASRLRCGRLRGPRHI